MARHGAGRDAAAHPDDQHLARVGMEQHRQVPQHQLGRRVADRRGVGFAVDTQHDARPDAVDRHRPAESVPVEEHLLDAQDGGHRHAPAGGDVGLAVDGRAADHDARVPHGNGEDQCRSGERARGRRPAPPDRSRGRHHDEHAGQRQVGRGADLERGMHAVPRHEAEAREQDAADGADRVDRVGAPRLPADVGRAARGHGDRARQGGADQQGRGQERDEADRHLQALDEAWGVGDTEPGQEELGDPLEDEQGHGDGHRDCRLERRERRG